MEQIMQGFASGEYRAIVDSEVPFAEAARAQERLTSRSNFGKVLLVP
jgi:NADPH:quinone reductase-like Zn-dependent oxidoreductase